MGVLDLPPLDYRCPNDYVFGPWRELWIVTDPELSVRMRRGWVVQIGAGTIFTEKSLLGVGCS